MIASKTTEFDAALNEVIGKIDAGTVTCEDFNGLIKKTLIGESTPESIRNRVRRHTIRNATDSHIEPETGHQPLEAPNLAARVQPKRQPVNQQNHGRAKQGHRHSVRSQAAAVPPRFQSAMEYIEKYHGKPLTEDALASIQNKNDLKTLTTKLLLNPRFDRDWLHSLLQKL